MTDGKKPLERFGKYLILDHLFDGGMAKICRARFLGEQADKLVAIKMVQPQFSKDPSFVQMFEDELKVTFALQHPNIAQMYDYGMVNGQLYTAMELVDGANLKQYLDRLKSKNFVFPVEISTYIISQVCQALQYAHTFTDKMTGKKLNIIHRDISPHNIMLTYDGAIKVIDFGIAKADSNSEATQAGTIKGKLSYLAPEYLDGLELDPRYDEFAVGITLWELLCSRKLFTASNDLAVLKQIQACKVPVPSSINPNVPKELDEIVLKALSKDRNERYEDMDKFNRALVKFLYSNYPDFNATDLGYFANQLFQEEITKDKQKFKEYGKIDIRPYIQELVNEKKQNRPVSSENNEVSDKVVAKRGATQVLDFDIGGLNSDSDGLELGEIEPTLTRRHINKEQTMSRKLPVESASSKTNVIRQSNTEARRVSSSKSRKINQKQKNRKRKEKNSGSAFKFVLVAASLAIVYAQSDFVSKIIGVDLSKILGKKVVSRDVAQDGQNNLADSKYETEIDKPMGTISLIGYESDMEVFVNGTKAKLKGFDITVDLNKEISILITKSGYRSFRKENIILTKNDSFINLSIPELAKEKIGLLSTSQNFTTGSKLVFEMKDGLVFDKKLPLTNERIPAGIYEGIIKNPLLGTEKKVKFIIEENKRFYLE